MKFRKYGYKPYIALLLILVGAWGFRISDKYFEIAKSLDIMAAVYRDLNVYYVDSLDPSKLMETGIEAMTQSLDPYTYYFAEDELSDLDFLTTGKYGGVGTSIRKTGDSVVVTEVYAHTPFADAGIRPGDILVSLQGSPTAPMSLDDISNLLKGDPGSVLRVEVRHPMNQQTTAYQVKRQEIDIHGVAYTGMASTDVGYIKMIQFTEGSSDEVKNAVKSLEKKHPGMKGLILDLRENPGGLLNEAVKTANLFITAGDTILSTRGRVSDWNRVYQADEEPLDTHIALAVLTNRHSASASEIVAGAVQDLDRGIIVGQRSFGKGLVQTTRDLPYHTKMKITTAKYYTPSGRCIQAIDYARHNEDGSIAYIPDSMKRDFHTHDGRVVMDGGGIEPDQLVPRDKLSNITTSLINKNLLFDYATRYFYSHPTPPVPGEFHLGATDFKDFEQFLSNKDYSYKTQTEEALEQLREVARQEGYFSAVNTDYESLKQHLAHNKEQDLLKHQPEICRLLEMEIMSRYYFQEGRIAQELPSDPVVLSAVSLLDDPIQYQKLLHKDLEQ